MWSILKNLVFFLSHISSCEIMKRTLIFIFFALFLTSSHADAKPRKQKLLILIIASDNHPAYIELQKIWRAYMHLDPSHMEAYFIKGDPDLKSDFEIKGDTIWSKTPECFVPGIINKTILSLEAMRDRRMEFDFVLRTNLSSFLVFPRVLKFLETLPKTRCYCSTILRGGDDGSIVFGSGAGFFLSRDLAELMVEKKHLIFQHNCLYPDDVLVGYFLQQEQVRMLPLGAPRLDFPTLESWLTGKDKIPADVFHIRTKNQDHLRLTHEVYIQTQLLKMFYNVSQY